MDMISGHLAVTADLFFSCHSPVKFFFTKPPAWPTPRWGKDNHKFLCGLRAVVHAEIPGWV